MTRGGRDRRAAALLEARAATLRELARKVKRLEWPKAQETTRQARLDIVADLAQLGGELYPDRPIGYIARSLKGQEPAT